MKVSYKKRFLKDIEKLPMHMRHAIEEIVFKHLVKAESLVDIKGLKKIHGFDDFYRLKYSDYRIGFVLKDDLIVFCRVMHKKDIYRYFP